jgi:hypothetical protein
MLAVTLIETMMQLTPELVALTIKDIQDDGPEPGWTPLSEVELDDLVDRIEDEAGSEPLLVFAYGSLIWNPEFEPVGRQRATAYGWHRSFSLKIERWRATSSRPGLMKALERGGQYRLRAIGRSAASGYSRSRGTRDQIPGCHRHGAMASRANRTRHAQGADILGKHDAARTDKPPAGRTGIVADCNSLRPRRILRRVSSQHDR